MAALLGLSARIYIPNGLSVAAIGGIRGEGAELIEVDAIYDDVVETAAASTQGSSRDVLTLLDGSTARSMPKVPITTLTTIEESIIYFRQPEVNPALT